MLSNHKNRVSLQLVVVIWREEREKGRKEEKWLQRELLKKLLSKDPGHDKQQVIHQWMGERHQNK